MTVAEANRAASDAAIAPLTNLCMNKLRFH
jgi:hypothetical protein